jgi:hypothetical protein
MKVKQCGDTCETMKWLTLNISEIFCIGKSLRKLPSTHVTPIWCWNGVKVVLQWCYKGVLMVCGECGQRC